MEKTIEGGKLLLQMWREGNYMKHRAKRLAKIRAEKEDVREDFIRGRVGSLSSMAKSLKPFKTAEYRQHRQQYQGGLRSSLDNGGVFGAIEAVGSLTTAACNSLIRGLMLERNKR